MKVEDLPNETIDFKDDLLPAVRAWLSGGLSEDFQRSCVCIGCFDQFSGGLKAKLVGGLRIDVNAVLKLGGLELKAHRDFSEFINARRPNTFPMVVHLQALPSGQVLLLMEKCRGYVTLLEKVFCEPMKLIELNRILKKVFSALGAIHSYAPTSFQARFGELPHDLRPFGQRLKSKIDDVIAADSELGVIMNQPGIVNGAHCAPVTEILANINRIEKAATLRMIPCLVHGDPHLGNIMVRKNGPTGFRVRMIDPNTEIGYSHPLYDIGKLIHWAEPVGWAKIGHDMGKRLCRSHWQSSSKRGHWRLEGKAIPTSEAAEQRRRLIEKEIRKFSERYRSSYGAVFNEMVSIAIASAHVGLAALFKHHSMREERRFILAYTLRHLAWLPRA